MKWDLSNTASLELFPVHNSLEYNVGMRKSLVLICPGGGFIFKSDREAQPIAARFNAMGMHAAVLFYTAEDHCPDVPNQASKEVHEALKILIEQKENYLFDENQVYLCAFSAGGYIAPNYIRRRKEYDDIHVQIKGLILGYPAIHLLPKGKDEKQFGKAEWIKQSHNMRFFGAEKVTDEMIKDADLSLHIEENQPAVFIWTTFEDQLVDCKDSIRYALACAEKHVPVEFHLYEKGEHGLALCDCTTARKPSHFNSHVKSWITLLENWVNQQKGQ